MQVMEIGMEMERQNLSGSVASDNKQGLKMLKMTEWDILKDSSTSLLYVALGSKIK